MVVKRGPYYHNWSWEEAKRVNNEDVVKAVIHTKYEAEAGVFMVVGYNSGG